MSKKSWAKIVAFLALFAIIIWIAGTGILILVSSNNVPVEQKVLTTEELQNIIDSNEEIEAQTLSETIEQ